MLVKYAQQRLAVYTIYIAITYSINAATSYFEANKSGEVNHWVRGQLGEAEFSKTCILYVGGLGHGPQKNFEFQNSILGYFQYAITDKIEQLLEVHKHNYKFCMGRWLFYLGKWLLY